MNATKENNEGFQDQVIVINRVAKVVKGGRRFSFSALVVVGDKKNQIGFGVGKAGEVPDAIKKASDQAKKNLFTIQHKDGTIPYDVIGRFGSCSIQMHPARSGKGIIAGAAVRTIMELGGVKDIVCKIHGSKNGHNVVRATVDGIKQLISAEEYAKRRDLDVSSVLEVRANSDRNVASSNLQKKQRKAEKDKSSSV